MSELEITSDQRKEGAKIAKELGVNSLFVNNKGEFFTEKNRAALSVKNDKNLFTDINFANEAAAGKTGPTAKELAQKSVDTAQKKYDGLVVSLGKATDPEKAAVQAKVGLQLRYCKP